MQRKNPNSGLFLHQLNMKSSLRGKTDCLSGVKLRATNILVTGDPSSECNPVPLRSSLFSERQLWLQKPTYFRQVNYKQIKNRSVHTHTHCTNKHRITISV